MESEAATNPGVGNTLDILVSDTWGYPDRDIWRAVRRKTLLSCFYESSDKCVTPDFPLIVLPLSSASFLVSPRLLCLNEIAMILMLICLIKGRDRESR